jgi:hypothetical protein
VYDEFIAEAREWVNGVLFAILSSFFTSIQNNRSLWMFSNFGVFILSFGVVCFILLLQLKKKKT